MIEPAVWSTGAYLPRAEAFNPWVMSHDPLGGADGITFTSTGPDLGAFNFILFIDIFVIM